MEAGLPLSALAPSSSSCLLDSPWLRNVLFQATFARAASHPFDAINSLGGVMKISIAPEYRDIKLDELRLMPWRGA